MTLRKLICIAGSLFLATTATTLHASTIKTNKGENFSKTSITPDSEPAARKEPGDSNKTISLSWTAPLTRMDGTSIALSEIDHYRIRYGNNAKKLGKVHKVDSDEDSYTFQDLPRGHWHFSITVVDQAGRESPPSDLVSKSVE